MDALTISDGKHRDRMARGSAELRRAILIARDCDKHLPAKSLPRTDLIWSEDRKVTSFAPVAMSASALRQGNRARVIMAQKEAMRARVVKRDPCPCCGTRQDIGCEHRRAG